MGVTTTSIENRWRQHLRAALNPNARPTAIRSAIRKHGPDAFEIQHIASARSRADLLAMEKILIAQLGTNIPGRGYNMTEGGEAFIPMTGAQRIKIAAALRGRPKPPEFGARIAAKLRGRKLSPEHRSKLIGRIVSEATRAKMRAAWAKRRARGNPLSAETRAKLSAAAKRRGKLTPAGRAKLVAALRARTTSAETRARQSEAAKRRSTPEYRAARAAEQRARRASAATRAKMAAAQKERWARIKAEGRYKPRSLTAEERAARSAALKAYWARRRAAEDHAGKPVESPALVIARRE